MYDDSPWFTREEAAGYAKASIDALGDALRSEELRGYQTGKRGRWRIHREDLDAWIRGEKADVRVPAVTRRRSA